MTMRSNMYHNLRNILETIDECNKVHIAQDLQAPAMAIQNILARRIEQLKTDPIAAKEVELRKRNVISTDNWGSW